MVASDKLFFWLFQERTDRLLPLVTSFLADMEGYSFTAPVIKEREVRLDGLFLPPPEQLQDKPALIMEAQMAANPEFFLRLYNGSSLLLTHQYRQGQPVRHWRVLVICPSRDLHFGDPVPVAEFLRERVVWIELAPERMPPSAPPLQRALGLLLLPEDQLPASSAAIRQQAAATPLASEMDDVIAAILLSRFNGRSITEICAMGGSLSTTSPAASPTKKSLVAGWKRDSRKGDWKGCRKGYCKVVKRKLPPWLCACCNAAAALFPPISKIVFRLWPWLTWKIWPTRCWISRAPRISPLGWLSAKVEVCSARSPMDRW